MERQADPGLVWLGWTERAYASLPLSPAAVGSAFAGALLLAFGVSEVALGRHHLIGEVNDLSGARIAIVLCLLAAYLPTAYIYVQRGFRGALDQLRGDLDCSDDELSELRARVGRYSSVALGLSGLAGVALLLFITRATTPPQYDPWNWSLWTPEVRWHRVLNPWLGWWTGLFVLAGTVESRRLARLASRLVQIDVLDLRAVRPFTRMALLNALIAMGAFGVALLILADTGFWDVVLWSWIVAMALVATSLWIALLPVHRVIRGAKENELAWCREQLRRERAKLRDASPERTRIEEIVAYQGVVERVSAWPVDSTTYVRFSLYLLIPLGSWAGGAIVERFVDSLLG